jgi:hypothetical protein
MAPFAWALIALVGFVIFGLGLWKFVRGGFPADRPAAAEGDAELPMAPQQRRARWGLVIGAVMSAAIVAVFIAYGPGTYYRNPGFRLLTYGLFAVWLVAHLTMLRLTRPAAGESEVVEDERDRAIRTRALTVSLIAVFVVLAAWAIGLTEYYWVEKAIPIDYPYFILWSALVVGVLSREVGVLMGYAGWHGHGES